MRKQEVHVPYKYKILELFGGIGAPRKALDNLYADCKIKSVDYVDILNWAVEAYRRIAPNCYLPQSIEQWNIDVDILFHGSPCQDFSIAGKQAGGVKGSGTRSSLLWETIDIIKNRLNKLPKVVIWENVPSVLNKRHIDTFNAYLEALKELGYENKWEILNGIDFGIPQRRRRVFVVSIHKNHLKEFCHFEFINLQKCYTPPLASFLENNVDKKYFIKQKSMIKAIERGKIKIVDNVVQTITTKQMRWNNAGVIKIPFTTFNQENYVFNVEKATLPCITASGANSRLKIAIPKFDNDLPVFIIDNVPYHLRVITPREAWRLMGFEDKDFDKIKDFPETAKYFLAGNSIIVPVLEALFEHLLWKGER